MLYFGRTTSRPQSSKHRTCSVLSSHQQRWHLRLLGENSTQSGIALLYLMPRVFRKRQSRKHKVDERGILLITYAEWPRQLG
jgi:hypothetical protein